MMSKTLTAAAEQSALLPVLACAGLVIFGLFFAGVLVWVSRKENRERYRALSRMPLESNEVKP